MNEQYDYGYDYCGRRIGRDTYLWSEVDTTLAREKEIKAIAAKSDNVICVDFKKRQKV